MKADAEIEAVVARALERVRPAYLSREQLANELGITLPTLRKLEAEEGLPVHQIGPRVFRYVRSEVDAWILAHGRRSEGEGSAA